MKNSEKFSPEYSRQKAEELRDALRGTLVDVARHAGMEMHVAERYLIGERVMTEGIYRKLQAAVAQANSQVALPALVESSEGVDYDDGLEALEYRSGRAGNAALVVRFSALEWHQIKGLFPEDADIEGAVRAFIIKMLDTDEKRQLYCPKKPETEWTHAGLPKEEKAFYEDDAVRVAVDYAAFVRNRLEQVLSWAEVQPEEFFGRLVEQSLFGPEPHELEDMDDDERDRCLSVRVWRERALAAEHEVDILRSKLRRIKAAADLELEA